MTARLQAPKKFTRDSEFGISWSIGANEEETESFLAVWKPEYDRWMHIDL